MLGVRTNVLNKYLGLSLVSASVLALQVIFTRIFSIMIWHHFTYLVIGVALLGGGAAGTYLAIQQWNAATITRRISNLAIAFSLSILLDLLIITQVRFDPLRTDDVVGVFIGLALYFAALFATFFLGGLTIVSAFRLWGSDAHRLYFADLLGAGISTLVVMQLIRILSGPSAIIFVALLALVPAFLFSVQPSIMWRVAGLMLGAVQIGLLLFTLANPVQLPIPSSKPLEWALRVANASQPEYTRWNPVARVDVTPSIEVGQPSLLGGISQAYVAQEDREPFVYQQRFVTLDGTSMTALHGFDGDLSRFAFLRHAIISAPYQVGIERPKTLLIGIGGGIDIILARLYEARQITAIDLNTDMVELLKGRYADFTGWLADDPRTQILAAEGRSFLTRDGTQYDIIQGIGLDNIAALNSGAYVLSESYLYTVEAFELALQRLTPQGVFAWTRFISDPPSGMLRLVGMAAEALRRQGAAYPAQHIAVVAGTGANESTATATLLVSRQPFTVSAVERLRSWAAENEFDLVHDPLERLDTVYADYLHAPDPRVFAAAYALNISPVTDDNPFYYNYFRWSNLHFDNSYTGSAHTRLPVANLIILVMLAFISVTAVVFIVVPLMRYRRTGLRMSYSLPILVYFSALGLGYIFVEIILIQRFTLFIGYPTHAITTTIFSMLSFSAIGSLVSQRICVTERALRIVLVALAGLMTLYIVALPRLLHSMLGLPDTMRAIVAVVLIAPLGCLMGMPFPVGLRRLGVQAQGLIPWAWGLNGVFSVLGSVLVVFVGMLTNFTIAFTGALLFYIVAVVVSASLWKAIIVDTPYVLRTIGALTETVQ